MPEGGSQVRGAHLVGSVPLPTADAVFRSAGALMGDRLRRFPDGEVGRPWLRWQFPNFADQPMFEQLPPDPGDAARGRPPRPQVRLRPGVQADAIRFGPLGYATAAGTSYAIFRRLRDEGVLPARSRFLVTMPTPLAPVDQFVVPEDQEAVEPAYEACMLAEVDEIVSAIPAGDLGFQWDAAKEMLMWDDALPAPYGGPARFGDLRQGIIDRIARISGRLPEPVELGYHLCYGDAGHRHLKEPDDTARATDLANAILAAVRRPVQWMHIPVPRERSDDAYFAPLRDLRLRPETELYLGLVHYTDGVEGTRRRIAAAQKVVPAFGVATECGFGRRPPETIPDLMRIHAAVAAPVWETPAPAAPR
jgi:hypothetical protein